MVTQHDGLMIPLDQKNSLNLKIFIVHHKISSLRFLKQLSGVIYKKIAEAQGFLFALILFSFLQWGIKYIPLIIRRRKEN